MVLVRIGLYYYEESSEIIVDVDDIEKFRKELAENLFNKALKRVYEKRDDEFLGLYEIADALVEVLREDGYKVVTIPTITIIARLIIKDEKDLKPPEEFRYSKKVLCDIIEHNRKVKEELMRRFRSGGMDV